MTRLRRLDRTASTLVGAVTLYALTTNGGHDGGVRYNVVIIGSGFGGSVAALRLVEKGYTVAVLEAGRRFADDEFPRTSWRTRKFLWAPALGCYGIQRFNLLHDVLVLSGAGVGGGSLVYANTLYRPLRPFYDDPQLWSPVPTETTTSRKVCGWPGVRRSPPPSSRSCRPASAAWRPIAGKGSRCSR